MGDESKGTPDPGNKVATPDTGKNVTPEQVTDIVAKAVAAALAPFQQSFEKVTATVNGLAADKRRGTEKTESKGSDKQEPSNEEVSTLRDEVQKLREERQRDKKKLALKDALDAHGDTIAGRNHLERLIGTELDFDSTGNVVAVVDGKHVPLKDRVKSYADDPQWQKPSGTNGTGRPEGNKKTESGSTQIRKIKASDQAEINRSWRDIKDGKAEVVAD